jgi:hypothetical protein
LIDIAPPLIGCQREIPVAIAVEFRPSLLL